MDNFSLIQRGNSPSTEYLGGVLEVIKPTFQSWVREVMEEVFSDMMSNTVEDDRLLTVEELCERWNISKNTLHTWEKNGIISPLNMGGKRKLYSLSTVHEVEMNGMVKPKFKC